MTEELEVSEEKAARIEARRIYRKTKSRRHHAVTIITVCCLAGGWALLKFDFTLLGALVSTVGVIGAIWGEPIVTFSMEYPG
ncbi:MAG: hypothetical protein K5821_17030 [Nitrobacter sp.]|uniref:hypothetical protein n=1 Tax=Nitrobacter sp. TaxID=29420 RepID=UPI002609EF1F|nr:hypothetical protein [Nitrobacter sp.]MCV0388052.1 hypothetical protein [Nitrobacter sp.]